MKIAMLVPCLMLDNNRKANRQAMEFAKLNYNVDTIVVNDQEFLDSDYLPGIEYIGHHDKRVGFVKGRNELLKWFYNSDYDYAVWLDANAKISKTSLNDFTTLLDIARRGELPVDGVLSTLGICMSADRMTAKKMNDYFDKVYLVRTKTTVNDWMHGLLMKNFSKYYNEELYIDERCNPRLGTSEDVFFVQMLKKLYDIRLCPTITVNKPNNKTSTWVADKKGYDYTKLDYDTIYSYVAENCTKQKVSVHAKTANIYRYDRVDAYKDLLRPYRPRNKKLKSKSLI